MSEVIDDLRRELANLKARVTHLETSEYAAAIGDADTVDGFHAAAAPMANKLLAMNASAKFPTHTIAGDLRVEGSHRQSVAVGVRVYRNANMIVAHSTYTPVSFTHQRWDAPDDDQWTIGDPTKLICRIAGTYIISANFRWQENAVGSRGGLIQLNAATNIAQVLEAPAPNSFCTQSMTFLYKLAMNDFLVLHVLQFSGGNLNLEAEANYSPEFSMVRIP